MVSGALEIIKFMSGLTISQVAAGVLPFFDDGRTILLGQEYRERTNSYAWMEFGGKREEGESLAKTACREANEETACSLQLDLHQVELAESKGHYVDHYNENTGVFYRMYVVKLEKKPKLETFKINAKTCNDVEKVEWQYFNTTDVISSCDGHLPGTDVPLYSTMRIRLAKLRDQEFFPKFIL
jgi:8-oxo-dGTP pyrophosphatase MutT (NUDIX family)